MASFLVTYDFKNADSNQRSEFVEQAAAAGLIYVFPGADKLSRLPDSTLWGVFENSAAMKGAFDEALVATEKAIGKKITLEKRFIAGFSSCRITSDKQKAPDSRWKKATKFETCREHQKKDKFFAY